ncbi:hypothetical protein QBC47DRAFT_386484 [Echria macrotheca]|uniref:Diphthine methyltransferase n=1 Tax=Echria macrotheca TaxID=438768 RepID=A0AAJ0F3H6_9PEZI|nr:hypothetical protein QBC47DRAFT_386484 [Echria macrotheca]
MGQIMAASAANPRTSMQSLRLDLPPSCVEFCPADPAYFLVGTYNLEKSESLAPEDGEADGPKLESQVQTQSRNGSLIVFQLVNKAIIHLQTEQQSSAVLDLHFNPNPGWQNISAVVSSTATLSLFELSPLQDKPLKALSTANMAILTRGEYNPPPGTELLFLSCCWHPTRADTITISTSAGNVHLVNLGRDGRDWTLHPNPVLTHSLEAWCVAISPYLDPSQQPDNQAFTIFSGGDDSVLHYRTCSIVPASETTSLEYRLDGYTSTIKRDHNAGVTAILPLGLQEGVSELVITGSYDDHIRLFAVASAAAACTPRPAKLLAESDLAGGVWRLKLIDLKHSPADGVFYRLRILASCMHAGVRVVELVKTTDGDWEFLTVGSFEEHKSMNYGTDYQTDHDGKLCVISTSFYDKLLCLWEL